MKHIFKDFKWYDYLIILVIIGTIVTQTYFEMEFIEQGKFMLENLQSLLNPTATELPTKSDIWQVGGTMLWMAGVILSTIILVNEGQL